jgi:hypothetical protein
MRQRVDGWKDADNEKSETGRRRERQIEVVRMQLDPIRCIAELMCA